jgi:ubiquinone/menaquinone biosynthesis C-methylase UbiE
VSSALNVGPDSHGPSQVKPATREGCLRVDAVEGYERWAPIYDDAPNPLLAREERYLLPLLGDLSKKSVLDLACGTGRWLERLVAQGSKSGVGVDRSSAMLRVARRKSGIRRQLVEAACENLPFSNASFDLAICSFALGHIGDLEAMVLDLARVMRPGADVFVSDLHPEAYERGWRVGFRDGAAAVQIEMRSRSVEEIVQAFLFHGFECRTHVPLWLGEPEESLFAQAGKSHSFAESCRLPAVLICHFRRLEALAEDRRAE